MTSSPISKPETSLCVFCGSNPGAKPVYRETAEELGHALVARGTGLVFGGGDVGLMGCIADVVMAGGGHVTGVIPEGLARREVAHRGLSVLEVVDSMHARKQRMAELSSAFVALPGGLGTFEEILEIITWAQLGIHRKACGLLNVDGYFDPLLAMLDHGVAQGFVKPQHRELVLVGRSVEEMLGLLAAHEPAKVRAWMSAEES